MIVMGGKCLTAFPIGMVPKLEKHHLGFFWVLITDKKFLFNLKK